MKQEGLALPSFFDKNRLVQAYPIHNRHAKFSEGHNTPSPGVMATYAIAIFFSSIIIVPNSAREFKLVLFPCLAVYCFSRLRKINTELLNAWIAIVLTTVLYLLYPSQPDLTPSLVVQITFVFGFAPLFWIIICEFVIQNYSFESVKKFLFWCVIVSLFTVMLYYFLFINFGRESVAFFMGNDHANAKFDTKTGNYGATMHVFGSLIFLGPAFIASETLVLSKKLIIVVTLAIITIVSGRDALILTMLIGVGIYGFFRCSDVVQRKITLPAILVLLIFIGIFCSDLGSKLIGTFTDKLLSLGGNERRLQFDALSKGISTNWLMGSGHTAYVEYVRNAERPWRYELLPLALLYRVGIIGFLCYSYPIIASFWRVGGLVRSRMVNQIDIFFGAGLLATIISTTTNPYLSSFEFQWCLFFPYCYFRYRTIRI